jgi:plasmid stabilization system protein ParE
MVTKKFRIEWSPSAIEDLDEILEYITVHEGSQVAIDLYAKISSQIETLFLHPKRCRIVPELKRYGVIEYRELIVAPYRVFIRVKSNLVSIVGIIDGRRDLEEILIHRVIDDI